MGTWNFPLSNRLSPPTPCNGLVPSTLLVRTPLKRGMHKEGGRDWSVSGNSRLGPRAVTQARPEEEEAAVQS